MTLASRTHPTVKLVTGSVQGNMCSLATLASHAMLCIGRAKPAGHSQKGQGRELHAYSPAASYMLCRWETCLRQCLCHAMQVDVYTKAGKQVTSLSSEFQTAISSRCVFHPNGAALAAATASGRVLVYR